MCWKHGVSRYRVIHVRTYNVVTTARAWSDCNHCSAKFRVIWVQSLTIHCADTQGENRVGVSIKVALIVCTSTVTCCEDENAALARPSFLHTIDHCFQDETLGTFHGFAIIGRTPRARINVVQLVFVVESGSLIGIGDGGRQNTDAGDLGTVGNPYTAYFVRNGGDLTSTAGAVLIIGQPGERQRSVIVEIV